MKSLFMNSNLRLFCLIVFFFSYCIGIGTCQPTNKKEYYNFSEPEFFRGNKGLTEFFTDGVKLNKRDYLYEITGIFNAVFTLTKDNTIKNLKMIDSTSSDKLNNELMEMVKMSNDRWISAKINGKPIDIDILVTFRLIVVSSQRFYYHWSCFYQMIDDPILETAFYNAGADEAGIENYAEAIKYFDEALLIIPIDIDALYNRGVCKLKSNDKNGACEDWKKIQATGKQDADKLLLKYCGN